METLTRDDACRVAVRAQLLAAERPTDVLDVVRHLTFVQLDPTRHVAPSADLVLWSRLGASYDAAELRDLLDSLALVDHHMLARPADDLALYRADMAAWPGPEPLRPWQVELRAWVEANDACRREVLAVLRGDGPLPISDLPDTCEVPWRSSGWNHSKNRKMLLANMVERGEVARAGRGGAGGREVLYDLAERIYPDDPVPSSDDARRERDRRRLRSLGIARAKAAQQPVEPNHVGEAGEAAVVEGVKGTWRVDPAWLDVDSGPRTAILSPLDRLVADRKRLDELFGFEYHLEMYKPVEQRRWGYWAMPLLHGHRLVGKLDAVADRDAGELRVDAIHRDGDWTPACEDGVRAEIDDLAAWLGLAPVLPD